MYTLIIEDRNGRPAAEISFDQGSYTIGRVDGNDVVLPSSSVSRTHARIFVSNNKCYIDDLGSANGVTVDGIPIKERTEISNGSKIRIGEYTLYLEYKDQSEVSSTQEVLKTQIVSGDQSGFKIVRIGDKFAGEDFMLSEAINSIGRTEDNYILLSDQSISRNHAKITNHGMKYVLTDLNSSNGTFVNNKKITGDYTLQSGDQVRFGNVSFLFVPASQVVDYRKYAKKAMDSRLILGIGISVVIIICIVLIVSIVLAKKRAAEELEQQRIAQEKAEEEAQEKKFNEDLEKAERLYEDKHFEGARSVLEPLMTDEKHKSSRKLQELAKRVTNEIENENIIKEAEKLVSNKHYEDAIEKFKEVEEDSMNREFAEERIKAVYSDIRVNAYIAKKEACDAKLDVECIEPLCAAMLELKSENNSEQEKLQEGMSYLQDVMTKHKRGKTAKIGTSANKCLSNFNQGKAGN